MHFINHTKTPATMTTKNKAACERRGHS